jgi:DNA repair protein RadD
MTFVLRDYQREAINALHEYWQAGGGNGLIVLPTGSGKSLVIAALCQEMLEDYPTMRIGIVTHVRELIAQDYKELLALWPEAPAGIYSAGIGRRDVAVKILFMGVQSVWNRPYEIGSFDLLLVDEAHLVSHEKSTTYRKLFDHLKSLTPDMRIAGLTATAFRLDTGRLDTGRDKLFDDVVYDANVRDLIEAGWLCKLISKKTVLQMNVDNVKKRGGEFITKDLAIAVDQDWITKPATKEIVEYGEGRKSWLAFCVNVAHAMHVVDELRALGVSCEAVFGRTPKAQRDQIIQDFRDGKFTCLVSVMVLGIGFNVPHVDMICLLRPTASGGLFVQQVGRGLRNAPDKKDCLVLDFAGNTRRHGSIDEVVGHTIGAAKPVVCEECKSYVPAFSKICPDCGAPMPEVMPDRRGEGGGSGSERPMPGATADAETDIVSTSKPQWLNVSNVRYSLHRKHSQPDAPPTLRVSYRCGLVTTHHEWICFSHPWHSYAYQKAERWWNNHAGMSPPPASVEEALTRTHELDEPAQILVKPDGKYMRIIDVVLEAREKV